jgi:DNA-binding MarR family transcriptional regulator
MLRNYLWDMMRITTMNMEAVFTPIVQTYGLTMMQNRILIAISQCDKPSVGSICHVIGASGGNASNMCKKLEKEGFIKRIRSKEDERVVELLLTEKGRETIVEIENEMEKKYKPILDSRSDEDYETIILGIKKLNELLTDFEKGNS